ncbi:unnamed protein product [Adineta steineri]|uniref:Uncharacterized protein n=1 Tax=Adineta steineri TaxID=433720 RepID=A0A815WRZ1_9BILA|nr:unnamed protein product [Adineta steineri]CAF1163874.1 unnamed protein product [Adineta steineri]CAF1269364.1 unnamed protein product [Adineta steineri]CAF1552813.1 unnamed protein product [Adineta steineri]
MIKTILLFVVFSIVYNQCNACDLCIIDSTCDSDNVHFNISVSRECQYPLKVSFTYTTDISIDKHYLNQTIDCYNCHFDLTIDPIRDAWIYTLSFVSPKPPSKRCSVHKANCVGSTSPYVWIVTGSLSGLFILSGTLLCIIRYCRKQ